MIWWFLGQIGAEAYETELEKMGVDVPACKESKQLKFSPMLDDVWDEGKLIPERVVDRWRGVHEQAIASGYRRVRGGGDMVSLFQQDPVVRIDDQLFIEKHFYFADQSILDLLTVGFIKGDPETALLEPNSMVLTEDTARKYFGSIDVLGRTVTADMNEMN